MRELAKLTISDSCRRLSTPAGLKATAGSERSGDLAGRSVVGLVLLALAALAGCQNASNASSDKELAVFRQAGPAVQNVDLAKLSETRTPSGLYRLVSGDVLELQIPDVVRDMPSKSGGPNEPYLCRVKPTGNIVLPILGEVQAVGRTLPELEAILADLYHPKYLVSKPSIVAKVVEYRSATVSLVGAVARPGLYELRSNEMTLTAALMKAGGITKEGATAIHVHRVVDQEQANLSIPVLDLNIASRDTELADGDTIVVEALEPKAITVIGLVNKPGIVPCSPKTRYTVMDALACAGGVNDIADPQYAKVYRQNGQGKVIHAVVKLDGPSAVGASELVLKPGDVVAVEQTFGTRTRILLAAIVRIGVGANAGANVGAP